MRKGWSLQQIVLGKLDIQAGEKVKNETGSLFYTKHKN